MFSETISTSYNFSMTNGETRYIRWGYANPDTPHSTSEKPIWSDYSNTDPFPNSVGMYTDTVSSIPPSILPGLSFSPQRNDVVDYLSSKNISTLRKGLYSSSHQGYPPACTCNLVFKDSSVTAEVKGRLVAQFIAVSMPPGL
jgi:hypothetical protein